MRVLWCVKLDHFLQGIISCEKNTLVTTKLQIYHRWQATPISLGLSWPLTNRHLLGVAIAIYFH